MANEDFDMALGARIRVLRTDRRCTADQLAAVARLYGLGWSRSTVSKIESGGRPVMARELDGLMRALNHVGENDFDQRSMEEGGRRVHHNDLALRDLLPSMNDDADVMAVESPGSMAPDTTSEASHFTEAERRAARQLGIDVDQLSDYAMSLWAPHGFLEEREYRIEQLRANSAAPRSLQAARGHVTRKLIAEIDAERRRQEGR